MRTEQCSWRSRYGGKRKKNGETFTVVNFSEVSKDDEGNKAYTNCSTYGDKSKDVKGWKQGDFIKAFGHERKSIDENGKDIPM